MKNAFHAAALCGALVLSFGFATVHAQESVPASDAENSDLWFVELTGAPTADGNSLSKAPRAEKAAFRKAAAAAGVSFVRNARLFDVLFNGLCGESEHRPSARSSRPCPASRRCGQSKPICNPGAGRGGGSAPNLDNGIADDGRRHRA